jgi:hypothetical protein
MAALGGLRQLVARPDLRGCLDGRGLLHHVWSFKEFRCCDRQGSGVQFFEIGRDRSGFKNETPAGQFLKTEHLTPDASSRKRSAKVRRPPRQARWGGDSVPGDCSGQVLRQEKIGGGRSNFKFGVLSIPYESIDSHVKFEICTPAPNVATPPTSCNSTSSPDAIGLDRRCCRLPKSSNWGRVLKFHIWPASVIDSLSDLLSKTFRFR